MFVEVYRQKKVPKITSTDVLALLDKLDPFSLFPSSITGLGSSISRDEFESTGTFPEGSIKFNALCEDVDLC